MKFSAVCLTVVNGSGGVRDSERMLPERSSARTTSTGLAQDSTPRLNGFGHVNTNGCAAPVERLSTNVRDTATTFFLPSETSDVNSTCAISVVESFSMLPSM